MDKKRIFRKIYSQKSVKKIEKKIRLLGSSCSFQVFDFLNMRFLVEVIAFLFCILFQAKGYFLAPMVVLILHFGSEFLFLDYPIKKRAYRLEDESIFFFEVLSLTLQGGKNLVSALKITSHSIDSELSLEFKKSLNEMKLGKSFSEALSAMKERIPSDTINNAISNIIQASIFGNNIEESLNNQLDFLRDKRLFDVKSEIAKLPTKISIISVVFFIPILLLVILAPVLINFVMR